MNYLSTKEIAQKWGISDRRVRTFCKENRIENVISKGGSYLIPEDAIKPSDNRFSEKAPFAYLKWGDFVIGEIRENYEVYFTAPEYNSVVGMYTKGKKHWSGDEFNEFLRDRIISSQRRDIEKLLYKLSFSSYNIFKIAFATKAINSKDLFWIANSKDEKLEDAVTNVFKSVFGLKKDLEGDSVDTPEGANIKRYAVYNGNYGIFKKRLHSLSTDVESEVAVYKLGALLGVECCPAIKVDEDTVFSQFMYEIPNEFIVHFRRFFEFTEEGFHSAMAAGLRGDNEYLNLLSVRPQYQVQILRMLALDFVTRQDDRHLSNIAVKVSKSGESFYPLYDNGRSLFYEDSPKTVAKACADPISFSTAFGPVGSYYDFICQAKNSGIDFGKIMNLNVKTKDVKKILKESGFEDYRLDGSLEWICKTIEMLK